MQAIVWQNGFTVGKMIGINGENFRINERFQTAFPVDGRADVIDILPHDLQVLVEIVCAETAFDLGRIQAVLNECR